MKTNPDHKARFSYGCACRCSCGWSSSTWYGKGAQRSASGEWREHREQHEAARIKVDAAINGGWRAA